MLAAPCQFFSQIEGELIEFARSIFRLSVIVEGVSVRAHLTQVERATGIRPKELDLPPLPVALAHVWLWFRDLDARRGSNGFGPVPISYTEIQAWASLMDERPRPWEIELIGRIDDESFRVAADARKKGQG